MPKVSVIVPVYNAENYLNQCVDSILGQTYQKLEVILVDDGSPDNCPAMCDAYAEKDSRVRVIHKKNGGVSSARNAGIRAATGEYISFIDSDDWLSPNTYERFISASQNGKIDFLMCDFIRHYGDGTCLPLSQSPRSGNYSRKEIKAELFPMLIMDRFEFPPTISNCVCFIRTALLRKHNVYYMEDVRISEDAPFGSQALYFADSFSYLKGEFLYHYRQLDKSRSKTYRPWWWDHYLKINEETEHFFGACQEYDFSQQIKRNMFYFARAQINYIMYDSPDLSFSEKASRIRSVMNHPRVSRMMKDMDTGGFPLSLKAVYWSIRYRTVSGRYFVGFLSWLRRLIKK